MAEGSALALCRGHATICLPIGEEEYHAIVENPKEFRRWLDRCYAEMPELFPEGFAQGYGMKDGRTSTKQGVWLRRVSLRDGRSYSVRRDKRDVWTIAYDHPQGHRTSNMLDRLMRSMNRYFDRGQHLHGSRGACDQHCRAWALLHNFTPWHPATTEGNDGWQSAAERLNRHRYHDNWLENLLVSASLGGYRNHPPQNP